MGFSFSFNGLCIVLFLIFMILKLCGVIAWTWAIVCIPLYCLGAGVIFTIVLIVLVAIFSKD